jgi:hypothetical protein
MKQLPPGFVLDEPDNSQPPEGFVVDPPESAPSSQLVGEWRAYLDRQNRIQAPESVGRADYGVMLDQVAQMRAQNGEQPPVESARPEAFARGVGDVFSFGMADELAGVVGGDAARTRARAQTDQAFQEHPVSYVAGGIVGAGSQGAGLAAAAPRAAQAGGAMLRAHPVMGGAALGGLEGGLQGFGSDTGGFVDRLDGAATGAAFGAATGGALPAAGRVVRGGARQAAQAGDEIVDAVRSRNAVVPELGDLASATRAAYQAVDDAGIRYSGRTMRRLAADISAEASEMNINAARHPRAASVIMEVTDNASSMTLTQLDQLRQVVRRDLMQGSDRAEAAFGSMIVRQIDDMIDRAAPAGGVEGAGHLIRSARQASRTQRASEALDEAIEAATDRASSSGTGGNTENAIRQNLRRLITNQRTSRLFTSEQRDLIKQAVRGDDLQNTLRLLGRFSPDGFLSGALGVGVTATAGPTGALLPAAGYVAKKASEARQGAQIDRIVRTVRGTSG